MGWVVPLELLTLGEPLALSVHIFVELVHLEGIRKLLFTCENGPQRYIELLKDLLDLKNVA